MAAHCILSEGSFYGFKAMHLVYVLLYIYFFLSGCTGFNESVQNFGGWEISSFGRLRGNSSSCLRESLFFRIGFSFGTLGLLDYDRLMNVAL